MSETAVPKAALGVGDILGDSLRIWLSNIVPIHLSGLLREVIVAAITIAADGVESYVELTETSGASGGVANIVATAFTTAIVVRIAYDAASDRPVNLGAAINGAIPHLLPIALSSFAVGLVAGLGVLLLVIPGLYLLAMWSVVAPAIVVERIGFRGMARSAELTKGYRWPVMGPLIIVFIVVILLAAAIYLVTTFFLNAAGLYPAAIVQLVLSPLVYGPFSVVGVMVYARLREIKDGIGVHDLAEVFA